MPPALSVIGPNASSATIIHVLDEVGSSLKDVVRVRYYIADRADVEAIIPRITSYNVCYTKLLRKENH